MRALLVRKLEFHQCFVRPVAVMYRRRIAATIFRIEVVAIDLLTAFSGYQRRAQKRFGRVENIRPLDVWQAPPNVVRYASCRKDKSNLSTAQRTSHSRRRSPRRRVFAGSPGVWMSGRQRNNPFLLLRRKSASSLAAASSPTTEKV